ncbi:UNC93-like protein MFSD11 [Bactrocera dorsalis]|uniref:UNC93-like protein MFSD11 n=1 Tax=Bactrocera dorsalis TaxID=27457 RepID=A0A6I9VI58_BACDO|nr:UNC93-like protein MFSD11 [Bactrocera dorsalis]
MDSKLMNILFMSLAFFTIFFAFQTTASLQKKILRTEHQKEHSFENSAFTSLGIYYFVFAATCWFVPPLVAVVGPRWSLVIGTITYLLFIVHFYHPFEWLLYSLNITLGVGSAIIYITQGNYIARNSDDSSVTRNSGIFLTFQQASYMISAILLYFKYANVEEIEDMDRYIIMSVLTFICIIGLVMLFFLRLPQSNQSIDKETHNSCSAVFVTIRDNIMLLLERDMLLLVVLFFYTGLVQAFYNGVYGPAMSFTQNLNMQPDELSFTGYILKGCGGFLGSLFFAILGDMTIRWGRDVFMYLAGVFHLFTFIIIYLNIPNESSFGENQAASIIDPPNFYLAIACSFLYGLGAAFYTVHIYSMLAGAFVAESTAGFGIYKFFQCLGCALAYLYSKYASLYIQMGILIVLLIAAVVCFAIVERSVRAKQPAEQP